MDSTGEIEALFRLSKIKDPVEVAGHLARHPYFRAMSLLKLEMSTTFLNNSFWNAHLAVAATEDIHLMP